MSTKTTFKRVALVAVAALGLGLLSVVPSSAAAQSDTLTLTSATTSATIGGTAPTATVTQSFIGLGGDTMTVTASLVSFPSGNAAYLSLGAGNTANNVLATPAFSGGVLATVMDTGSAVSFSTVTGEMKATLNGTLTAGTYVMKFTPAVSGPIAATAAAAAVTWTVTVGGAPAATAADSTWGMAASNGAPALGTHTAINTVKAVSATQVATILVNPLSAGGVALTASVKLSATMTGPGTLGFGNGVGAVPSVGRAVTAATAGYYYLGVWADGTAGTTVVTVSEPGGAVLFTATINFADALASFTLTPTNTITPDNGTDAVAIAGKDASGVTAPLGTYYVSSSNTAVATVPSSATGTSFNVTGVGVGTAVITVANASTSPTITKTYTVTVGKHTIKTLSIATDATSYAAGGAVVVTVKALGSDGLPVGDGTYNAFSAAVTSNLAVQGTLPTASIAFVGGKKTYTIYAPAQDGTVTLSGTEGSSTDDYIADTTSVKTITASFDSVNAGSSAAVDAANAATDAANYAADAADAATTAAQEATAAAQAAQDSADAATAAVVALGLRVDTLMASVRAQLTSLSNLLVRLIKKAHA